MNRLITRHQMSITTWARKVIRVWYKNGNYTAKGYAKISSANHAIAIFRRSKNVKYVTISDN